MVVANRGMVERCGTALAIASFGIFVASPQAEAAPDCGAVVTGSESLERDLICTVDPALTIDGGKSQYLKDQLARFRGETQP